MIWRTKRNQIAGSERASQSCSRLKVLSRRKRRTVRLRYQSERHTDDTHLFCTPVWFSRTRSTILIRSSSVKHLARRGESGSQKPTKPPQMMVIRLHTQRKCFLVSQWREELERERGGGKKKTNP